MDQPAAGAFSDGAIYVQLLTEKDFLMSLLRTLIICVIPIALTVLLTLLALFVTTIYFSASGEICPAAVHDPLHDPGCHPQGQHHFPVCRLAYIFEQPDHYADRGVLHHHSPLHLPGLYVFKNGSAFPKKYERKNYIKK